MNKWKGSRSTQLQEHWFGLSVIHRNRQAQHWDWKQGTKSSKNQHCKIFCECVSEWGREWMSEWGRVWVNKLTTKISLARTNDIAMNLELTCLEDDVVCKQMLFVQWNKSFFQEPIVNISLLTPSFFRLLFSSSSFFRLLFSSFSFLLLSLFFQFLEFCSNESYRFVFN